MRFPVRILSATALVPILVLTGCGTAPWKVDDQSRAASTPGRDAATRSTSPTPSPKPVKAPKLTVTPKQPVVVSDLASGAAEREVSAGPSALSIRYWSTSALTDWTAGASKPVTASITARGPGSTTLSSVQVLVDERMPDGWRQVERRAVTTSTVGRLAAISSPASSTVTSVVGQVSDDALAVKFTFVYQVVITGLDGRSSSYSAPDTLVVALARPEAG